MKTVWICALALLLAAAPALAEETAVAGYVLSATDFKAIEDAFLAEAFSGEMLSTELTETQTLLFVPGEEEHILPDLTVLITEPVPLADDIDEMVTIVQSILETMQLQQQAFPDEVLFNSEMAAQHQETGLGFAVGEQTLWLWAQDASGLMLPFYLYDAETGALADDIYLLMIRRASADSGYYAVYNDSAYVLEYLTYVEISSDASPFQQALVYWYLERATDAQEVPAEEGEGVTAGDTIRVSVPRGNVRAEGSTEAKIVGGVTRSEEYVVLSIAETGWYEIELADGTRAFLSPRLVEQVEP